MRSAVLLLALVVLVAVAVVDGSLATVTPEDGVITSGIPWLDTAGKVVHAHGGGFLVENGLYHWFGTSVKKDNGLSRGINLYTSRDLQHWTFVRMVFTNTSIVASQPGPYRIERPKVIYNELTQKFVMWFHLDTGRFTLRSVAVAVSDTIDGDYTFLAGFRPDGLESYDMSVFKDTDGAAYLVRSVENKYAGISQLTPDYLNTTGIISKGPRVEGQCIFKFQGAYYLLGSHLTGWAPNPAVLSRATLPTLHGTDWDVLGNPSGNPTTFNSQSTFVLPYTHPNGKELLIYMGDRWNDHGPGGLVNATYIWQPFVVENDSLMLQGTLNFTWHDKWAIKDFST